MVHALLHSLSCRERDPPKSLQTKIDGVIQKQSLHLTIKIIDGAIQYFASITARAINE